MKKKIESFAIDRNVGKSKGHDTLSSPEKQRKQSYYIDLHTRIS